MKIARDRRMSITIECLEHTRSNGTNVHEIRSTGAGSINNRQVLAWAWVRVTQSDPSSSKHLYAAEVTKLRLRGQCLVHLRVSQASATCAAIYIIFRK